MDSPHTVLIAVDYSSCSLAALRMAGRTFSGTDTRLHVVHALDTRDLDQVISSIPLSRADLVKHLENEAAHRLRETVAEELGEAEVTVHAAVGHPLDIMLKKVKDTGADLLVMGAFGHGGPGRGASAFSTKCTRRSPIDVLLVHDEMPEKLRRVVACIDFSDHSRRVAAEAARFAARDSARLVLVHAHSNPFDVYEWGKVTVNLSAEYDLYRKTLMMKLEELKQEQIAKHPQLDVQAELEFGMDYTSAVVKRVRDSGDDLVVIGAKGKSKLAYLLLGSTAEKVLRETQCSVLTVRVA